MALSVEMEPHFRTGLRAFTRFIADISPTPVASAPEVTMTSDCRDLVRFTSLNGHPTFTWLKFRQMAQADFAALVALGYDNERLVGSGPTL